MPDKKIEKNSQKRKSTKTGLSARVEKDIKTTLEREGPLRRHTLSEAVDHVLQLGMPLYLKQFPRVFKQAGSGQS